MKITQVKLSNFKRFTDLTISGIPETAKLVLLIGPNGCGKSSVFDSFEQVGGRAKHDFRVDVSYLRKDVSKDFSIELTTDKGVFRQNSSVEKKFFYTRSAYRIDPDFRSNQIGKKEDALTDTQRPKRLIDVDKRVQDNYERLVGSTVEHLYSGKKDHLTVLGLREELIGKVRKSMLRVFGDLVLESIGDPFTDGQFLFTKGAASNFPYKNLSAGEKGAFDIILDLIIKSYEFDDTIFAIDEPELHMHSRLQQSLLTELINLIPEGCQLWVATHSIGFIKGAIDIRKLMADKVVLLDLDGTDFDQPQNIQPVRPSPETIRKIFSVALDDLAHMVTPGDIIFCEGSTQEKTNQAKKDFDTRVYNEIFSDLDVLFFSADNKTMAGKVAAFAIKIVTDSGVVRRIKSIADRDNLTDDEIGKIQSENPNQKFLSRKTIENFLFDSEIIDIYCQKEGIDKTRITQRLTDVYKDDAKSIQGSIMQQCGYTGVVEDFKLALARSISPETEVYKALLADLCI